MRRREINLPVRILLRQFQIVALTRVAEQIRDGNDESWQSDPDSDVDHLEGEEMEMDGGEGEKRGI
jgi:hypothetical protein